MKIENNSFLVYHNETDISYITELTEALAQNLDRILRFFGLSALEKKITVRLWNSVDDYARYLKAYVGVYKGWMVADTNNGDINILSYDLYLKSESHENSNISDYRKILVHELVHICQQAANPGAAVVPWFWEALATNLSQQTSSIIQIFYTRDELIGNFFNLQHPYAIAYTLGRFLLENYTDDQILAYVKNPSSLIADTESILAGAKVWAKAKAGLNPISSGILPG